MRFCMRQCHFVRQADARHVAIGTADQWDEPGEHTMHLTLVLVEIRRHTMTAHRIEINAKVMMRKPAFRARHARGADPSKTQ